MLEWLILFDKPHSWSAIPEQFNNKKDGFRDGLMWSVSRQPKEGMWSETKLIVEIGGTGWTSGCGSSYCIIIFICWINKASSIGR